MMKDCISKANMDDLQEILNLQYLAYQSEAADDQLEFVYMEKIV